MADNYDNDKRPHGETGDTVQQAHEVSKPTTTRYPELDKTDVAQVPTDPKTGIEARESAGVGAERT